jgi:hypothetical protein
MRDKKGEGAEHACHFANYVAYKFARYLAYSVGVRRCALLGCVFQPGLVRSIGRSNSEKAPTNSWTVIATWT